MKEWNGPLASPSFARTAALKKRVSSTLVSFPFAVHLIGPEDETIMVHMGTKTLDLPRLAIALSLDPDAFLNFDKRQGKLAEAGFGGPAARSVNARWRQQRLTLEQR